MAPGLRSAFGVAARRAALLAVLLPDPEEEEEDGPLEAPARGGFPGDWGGVVVPGPGAVAGFEPGVDAFARLPSAASVRERGADGFGRFSLPLADDVGDALSVAAGEGTEPEPESVEAGRWVR